LPAVPVAAPTLAAEPEWDWWTKAEIQAWEEAWAARARRKERELMGWWLAVEEDALDRAFAELVPIMQICTSGISRTQAARMLHREVQWLTRSRACRITSTPPAGATRSAPCARCWS
jgi:hypothetical protein